MSRTVKRHKFWLIPMCVLVVTVTMFAGWPQLYAQDPGGPMPGGPGGPAPGGPAPGGPGGPGGPGDPNAGAAPAPAAPSEPTIAFHAVVQSGAKSTDVKNWDGQITSFIRFKYKTLDSRLLTVHLPAMYKTQTMTRAAWDTLFQCFSMDIEATITAKEDRIYEIGGEAVRQMLENLRNETPNVEGSGEEGSDAAGSAMDHARTNLPDIAGSGSIALPPLMF